MITVVTWLSRVTSRGPDASIVEAWHRGRHSFNWCHFCNGRLELLPEMAQQTSTQNGACSSEDRIKKRRITYHWSPGSLEEGYNYLSEVTNIIKRLWILCSLPQKLNQRNNHQQSSLILLKIQKRWLFIYKCWHIISNVILYFKICSHP